MLYITSIEQTAKEQERRSIAVNMLEENSPPDTIARVTGFTIAQLQKL